MEHDPTPVILLVDDDQDLLDLMSQALAKDGHSVVTMNHAPSHQDIERVRPALIFMDVELGEENGAALCHAVKSDAELFGAVVLISGHTDDRLRTEADAGGADAFLAKPFSMKALREWANYYIPRPVV